MISISGLDQIVNNWAASIQTPALNQFFIFISYITNPLVLAFFAAVVLAVLLKKRKMKTAGIFAFGTIGGIIIASVIKLLVARSRPANALIEASGFSFPSNHATMSIILAIFLIYFFFRTIKSKNVRIIFITLNVLAVALIDFDRIYLNVHWLSDIIGGTIFGALWSAIAIKSFSKLYRK